MFAAANLTVGITTSNLQCGPLHGNHRRKEKSQADIGDTLRRIYQAGTASQGNCYAATDWLLSGRGFRGPSQRRQLPGAHVAATGTPLDQLLPNASRYRLGCASRTSRTPTMRCRRDITSSAPRRPTSDARLNPAASGQSAAPRRPISGRRTGHAGRRPSPCLEHGCQRSRGGHVDMQTRSPTPGLLGVAEKPSAAPGRPPSAAAGLSQLTGHPAILAIPS